MPPERRGLPPLGSALAVGFRRPRTPELPQGVTVDIMMIMEELKFTVPQAALSQSSHFHDLLEDPHNYLPFLPMDELACVFGFYVLWILNRPLFPYQDLAIRDNGDDHAYNPMQGSGVSVPVTILSMTNPSYDDDPIMITFSRRLFKAFFLGQKFDSPYFQDAIMNEIVKKFRPDMPPTPSLVEEVYQHTAPSMAITGIKKLLIDYYIGTCFVPDDLSLPRICELTGIDITGIPLLSAYHPQFTIDIWETFDMICHGMDVVVDFSELQNFLCNAPNGAQKCRYHQHNDEELCFHLIVDSNPVDTGVGSSPVN